MIYIVNHCTGGSYAELYSVYLLTETDAQACYEETLLNIGGDPTLVELVRLDTSTLEAVTLKSFEGTMDDIEEGEEDEDEEEPVT